jgi:hypothetical protein
MGGRLKSGHEAPPGTERFYRVRCSFWQAERLWSTGGGEQKTKLGDHVQLQELK